MDRITYTSTPKGLVKTITQSLVVNVAEERAALEAQVADLKAGVVDTGEAQVEIDAVIANYDIAIAALLVEETKGG